MTESFFREEWASRLFVWFEDCPLGAISVGSYGTGKEIGTSGRQSSSRGCGSVRDVGGQRSK